MLKRDSVVLVNNEKYKNVEGVITGHSLEIVYRITPKEGKSFFVPERELKVIKEGESD